MAEASHFSIDSDRPKFIGEVGTVSVEILSERSVTNEARVVNIPIVMEETGQRIVHVPIALEVDNPSINDAYVPLLTARDRLRMKSNRPPPYPGECETPPRCGLMEESSAVDEDKTPGPPSPILGSSFASSTTDNLLESDMRLTGRVVEDRTVASCGSSDQPNAGLKTEQIEQTIQRSEEPMEQNGETGQSTIKRGLGSDKSLDLPLKPAWKSQSSSTSFLPLDTPVEDCIYQIKWSGFQNDAVPIVTQNRNGPCPLISLVNALLLSKRLSLSSGIEYQSGENLMSQLASRVLESVPEKVSEEVRINYEQNIQDALAILPKLQTGLDINVHFGGPRRYEFTQDTLLFDVLDVPLLHGWIYDKDDAAAAVVEKHGSYNRIVEFIISGKASDNCDTAGEALLAEDWLERTQSQLTYPGLVALVDCLQNDRPCVLFRNNHFSTIIKHEDQIYALVTDQGYATVVDCVWEQLSSVEGNTDFFDDKFRPRVCYKSVPSTPSVFDAKKQEELDLQLALSLSQSQDAEVTAQQSPRGEKRDVKKSGSFQVDAKDEQMVITQSDYELAKKLQAAEDSVVAPSPRLPPPQTSRPSVPVSQSAFELKERTRAPEASSGNSPYPTERRFSDHRCRERSEMLPPSNAMPHSTSMTVRSTGSRAGPSADQHKKEKCVIS